ncbi:unnamed protein product [Prorocentrum cordatum]|uniref:Uncharacterized protein n=1 Tax=Prorocentrum cordatum TaxID=2364126 RepID=A0ABN9W8T5_9DINO|nr:unnamed protein product [Polarella glacialis]
MTLVAARGLPVDQRGCFQGHCPAGGAAGRAPPGASGAHASDSEGWPPSCCWPPVRIRVPDADLKKSGRRMSGFASADMPKFALAGHCGEPKGTRVQHAVLQGHAAGVVEEVRRAVCATGHDGPRRSPSGKLTAGTSQHPRAESTHWLRAVAGKARRQ